MRSTRKTEIDGSGHDSFLDIVANLVGILVILIMVVGVRARHAREAAPSPVLSTVSLPPPVGPSPEASEAAVRALADAQKTVSLLHSETFQLDAKVARLQQATRVRRHERDRAQLRLAAAEDRLKRQRAQLPEEQRALAEARQRTAAAHAELETLAQQLQAATAHKAPTKTIEHHPTPLAKTVFGREEHFRLLEGRLAYVPISTMVHQLETDARSKLWKLKDSDQITETIGPVDGFRMKYTMHRRARRVQTPTGPAVRSTIELQRFQLLPERDDLGQPLATALQAGSPFHQRLAHLRPEDTTITVWTYPDSFGEFRQLKAFLFERGFLAAARPLPEGHPIGGSPEGSRSAAE